MFIGYTNMTSLWKCCIVIFHRRLLTYTLLDRFKKWQDMNKWVGISQFSLKCNSSPPPPREKTNKQIEENTIHVIMHKILTDHSCGVSIPFVTAGIWDKLNYREE